MEDLLTQDMAGQMVGFVALALCVMAFASRNDDRLLAILIFGNLAFAVQFALFAAWVASGISALIIVRIVLARRMQGNWTAMFAIMAATVLISLLMWQTPVDAFPLAAGVFGTIAMFMLRGIPMRVGLALAALCWIITNAAIGSIGAMAAEILMFGTNIVTIIRLARDRRRQAEAVS